MTLAEVIARDHDEIMTRWLEAAGDAASARGLDRPGLTNVMPMYLRSLATGEDTWKHVEAHFSTRLRQGFELVEIVDEFAMLGTCIVERCEKLSRSDRPDAAELEGLHAELNRASMSLVAMFDGHMHEEEQTTKRYLRLLQNVASAALQRSTPALTTALKEITELIMDAMRASSAAIAIRRPDGRLITVASTEGGPLEELAADSGTHHAFVDDVAESEVPTPLWDVASTELEVPASLRRKGIHSLLGVRLKSFSGLSGALYIAIPETRTFEPRELRRLESLAEQLVVYLDDATIFDELRSNIAALRSEQIVQDTFVALLAHDLRGPLSAARIGAELLIEDPKDRDVRRALGVRIARNLERIDHMIRDLLDANRIRAGELLALHVGPCDLTQIVRETVEELRMLCGDRFVVETDDELQGVWSPEQLRRALWNLAVNAVKYGDETRPIELRAHAVADRVVLSVHNWGPPISQDEQRDLFKPLTRTRTADLSGKVGWGLGLTIVRGIVEAHGGTVVVTSTAADGTTFTLEIPFVAEHPSWPAAEAVSSPFVP